MKGGFLEQSEIEDLLKFLNGNMDPSELNNYYFGLLGRYKEGHMLYGTGDAQACYLRAEEVVKNPPKKLEASQIKQAMNDISIGGKTQYPQVSNYWLEQVQGKASAIKANKQFTVKDSDTTGKAKAEFWERFDQSQLSLAQTQPKPEKMAESKRVDDREVIADNLIRRSCKFLLYDAIDMHKHVAYALDELDLSKVAYLVNGGQYPVGARARWDDASKSVVSDNEAKIPVCSSELRELFRYWDHMSSHVTFFKSFKKTSAPWEDPVYAPQWAAYAKQRASKLLNAPSAAKDTTLPKRIERCVNATDAAMAIGYYHDLRASRILGRGMKIFAVGTQSETISPDGRGKRKNQGKGSKGDKQ